MNVSRSLAIGTLLICSAIVALGSLGSVQAMSVASPNETVPDDGPAYGVNSSVYYRLWSDDIDENNHSLSKFQNSTVSSREEFEKGLAMSTDIPFSRPPAAVEAWNSGDVGDYSPGGQEASVAPESATLSDGRYIKDAFVSIVAVQPSTFLHRGNRSSPRQFIAPDGSTHAVSDYRVLLPNDDTSGKHREYWSLSQSSVENLSLSAGNRTVSAKSGHQAELQYDNLTGSTRLVVEANVSATLKQVIRDCTIWNSSASNCDGHWKRTVNYPSDTVNVSDSQKVRVNRLSNITGKQVTFAADGGKRGAVVHPDTEWSRITVKEDVQARSNWWFYTAGKPGWQSRITRTATNTSRSTSSVRPVQIHAFPSREASYVTTDMTDDGERPLVFEETWGIEQTGPSLPPNIDLSSANPYMNADSIAVTSTTLDKRAFREVTVHGIVRGQSRTVPLPEQQTVRMTNLTLTITNTNATHAVVRATVTETATGSVVTSGRVMVRNQTAALNGNGTATLTLSNPGVFLRGQYHPYEWWRTNRPYAAATDVAKAPGNYPDFQTLIQSLVVTMLWFIPLAVLVFGFDYMSDGALLGLSNRI